MDILHLITGLGQGGAEQVVYEIATRLDPARFRTAVCSILEPTGERSVYADRLGDAGIEVLSLGLDHKWQLRRAARLKNILESRRPDVLHCHMFHANILGRRMGSRAGIDHIISTVHISERRWRPWRFWLERWTDSLGDLTVCVSRATLEFQARKTRLPESRFSVIPNGIDTRRFAEPSRPPIAVRAELGIDRDARIVGGVGRLDRQKGYRYLIPAFDQLAGDDDALHLVIAGDGPTRRPLETLAAGTACPDRIHLLGRRDDVPDLIHAFDVFAMPSIYEGFGLTAAEAMAAGVPVVASAVDSLPEVLGVGEPEGPVGRLVPPRRPDILAEAIADILAHRPTEMIERARARARREYDVEKMVRRYAELYDSIAGQTSESQPPST